MIGVDKDIIEAFASLFRGRADTHGVVNKCVYEPVTLKHYENHLKGEANLGIYFVLDDSTCHFAAIDLDQKNFSQAKSIRDELAKNFIPAYIAASKSKGFHIYCFALEGFKATEIRKVLKHVLDNLNIEAEVFPKQDYHQPDSPPNEKHPEGEKHPGSYINLPSFGYTRPFLSGDLKEVPLKIALERIKLVPQESINRVLQTLPKEKPLEPKKVVGRRKKHPPCLEIVSNGVEEQQRDTAAFALARHYLIQAYEPEEVFWLLQEWDTKNKPPSYNEPLLEQIVRSAEKYRGFFCSLIKDKPTVSTFCVGDEKCDWPKPKKLEEEPLTQDEEPGRLNETAFKKLLETCTFLRHCQEDAITLAEPHWYAMITNLVVFGEPGKEKAHELSAPYHRYSEEETDGKIAEAIEAVKNGHSPQTCEYIEQSLGFDCSGDCLAKRWGIRAPAGLASRLAKQEQWRLRYLLVNDKGKVTGVNTKALVNDLLAEFTFKTIFGIVRDDILVYENGIYTQNGEKVIREECEARVGVPMITTHTIHEIRDRIGGQTFTDRERFNTEKYIINVKNGLLNVNTRELTPHTRDFLSTIRIPITYDPGAKCPQILKFLKDVLPEAYVNTILEFFGYALIPDYSIPVVLILLGSGANGKSQLFTILRRFIGQANCCSISIRNIKDYPFTLASLEGKLLNIQGDLSGGWFQDLNTLKMLTGQDPLSAPRKYKDTIDFDNFARLTFASNQPPKIKEDTLAIWRRILMISCPNEFRPSSDNFVKSIGNKISTPEELSGLLNLALDGLDRLFTNNDFTYEGTYEDRSRHYTMASDPARVFVDEYCDIGPEFKILKSDLYKVYIRFSEENKVQLKGEAQFGKELRQVPGLSISDKQYQERGERVRWWLGIKVRPVPKEEELKNQSETSEPDIDMEV